VTHKICNPALLSLTFATYGEVVRRPLYPILLLTFSAGILLSKFLTLFSFYQEMNMVREMGIATLSFWGFLILAVLSGVVVTQELEDRTALSLLSKPLLRRDFLLGKFAGLVLALLPGLLVLAVVLFLTLWWMAWPRLPMDDALFLRNAEAGVDPFSTAFSVSWRHFILPQGGVVAGGLLLSFLQSVLLAALAVSFSAFLPVAVSAAASLLLFVLGNLSGYMVASVESLGVAPLSALARLASWILPNFGYFNLQSAFSEGRLVSFGYLGLATAYTALYAGAVFFVACSLFQKREVR
jgi:ABC-type transport system involved in multi-copper enzyme maturation permease subunit